MADWEVLCSILGVCTRISWPRLIFFMNQPWKILGNSNKSGDEKATLLEPPCLLAVMQEEMNLPVFWKSWSIIVRADADTAFYSAKSRQSLGLGGLASRGSPDYYHTLSKHYHVSCSRFTNDKNQDLNNNLVNLKAKKPHDFWIISRKNGHCGANDRTSHRVLNRKLTNFKPFKG